MLIHHGIDDALEYPEKDRAMVRELMHETESWDSTARVASTSDWYSLTIAGIDHGNFSDLVLFMRIRRDAPIRGARTRSSTPTRWDFSTST
jgi:hypothetical protein